MWIAYLDPRPWRFLGHNHWVHHIWLWLAFGSRASAWSLTLIGVVVLLRQAMLTRQGRHVRASWRWIPAVLTVGLIGLPLIQLTTLLFFQNTLSGGEGMERALAIEYPNLINGELHRRGEPPLDLADDDEPADRLQSAGRQLLNRHLLRRDLVITGSRLTPTDEHDSELPTDLYFYAHANTSADASNGIARRASLRPAWNRAGSAPENWLSTSSSAAARSSPYFLPVRLPIFPSKA